MAVLGSQKPISLSAEAASGLMRKVVTEGGTFAAAPWVPACTLADHTFQRLTPKASRVTCRAWVARRGTRECGCRRCGVRRAGCGVRGGGCVREAALLVHIRAYVTSQGASTRGLLGSAQPYSHIYKAGLRSSAPSSVVSSRMISVSFTRTAAPRTAVSSAVIAASRDATVGALVASHEPAPSRPAIAARSAFSASAIARTWTRVVHT